MHVTIKGIFFIIVCLAISTFNSNFEVQFNHRMQDFVHLHVHSYFSILDGQASIKKLVDKVTANGMRGMALTDHGNMMGIKEFFNYCGKVNGKRKSEGLEPFKPIFGCEMYVVRNNRLLTDKDMDKGDSRGNHLIVLAKNEKGYHNLIKLVSKAWIDGFYGCPRTDHVELKPITRV